MKTKTMGNRPRLLHQNGNDLVVLATKRSGFSPINSRASVRARSASTPVQR